MGVTMWEICTGGKLPPATQRVLEVIRAGERVVANHFTSAKLGAEESWSLTYSAVEPSPSPSTLKPPPPPHPPPYPHPHPPLPLPLPLTLPLLLTLTLARSSSYSDAARAFLEALLEADPAQRISSAHIKRHAFFAETNFAAVEARRVPVPWDAETLEDLASKAGVEGLDERRTAAQTLAVLTERKLDEVTR